MSALLAPFRRLIHSIETGIESHLHATSKVEFKNIVPSNHAGEDSEGNLEGFDEKEAAVALRNRGAREGKPVRVLSIDGGGIRGIIPLVILGSIEDKTGKTIGELFDVVGGTSTGGIIALCIGECGDKVPENNYSSIAKILDFYKNRVTKVFDESTLGKVDNLVFHVAQYDAAKLENEIETVAGARHVRDSVKQQVRTKPRVFAVTTRVGAHLHDKLSKHADSKAGRPYSYLLRNYLPASSLRGSNSFLVKHAMRSTSAAPGYWIPVSDQRERIYVDGGVGANNPTMLAYTEAYALFSQGYEQKQLDAIQQTHAQLDSTAKKLDDEIKTAKFAQTLELKKTSPISLVLSLGTGVRSPVDLKSGNIRNLKDWITTSLTTGETVHDACSALFEGAHQPAYFRFQPRSDLGSIDLAEQREDQIKRMIHETEEYLKQDVIKARFDRLIAYLKSDEPVCAADYALAEAQAGKEYYEKAERAQGQEREKWLKIARKFANDADF